MLAFLEVWGTPSETCVTTYSLQDPETVDICSIAPFTDMFKNLMLWTPEPSDVAGCVDLRSPRQALDALGRTLVWHCECAFQLTCFAEQGSTLWFPTGPTCCAFISSFETWVWAPGCVAVPDKFGIARGELSVLSCGHTVTCLGVCGWERSRGRQNDNPHMWLFAVAAAQLN